MFAVAWRFRIGTTVSGPLTPAAILVLAWFALPAILCGSNRYDHGETLMLNLSNSLIGPLEQSVMECFWLNGPQTSGEILATLRERRTIAHSTVTTTLSRLYDQDLLMREPITAHTRKPHWRYTARHPSRAALLAGVVAHVCDQLGADRGDRAEALALLGGAPR
jgi:predicted transcriptional regulator